MENEGGGGQGRCQDVLDRSLLPPIHPTTTRILTADTVWETVLFPKKGKYSLHDSLPWRWRHPKTSHQLCNSGSYTLQPPAAQPYLVTLQLPGHYLGKLGQDGIHVRGKRARLEVHEAPGRQSYGEGGGIGGR